MDFEKNVPEWNAQGTEPPESLKTTGFEAGYKPPAAVFNWFWNRVSACLTEIREKLKGHADNKENPHGVTAAQVGLDKVNNTPDTEKAVAFAQEAGVARKAQSAMTIHFNGGRTEGTDQWTYDGSTGRSANITADKIGAAEKDLSNVGADAFRTKASSAGAYRIPTVSAASADGVAYTATVEGVTELYNGMLITIIPATSSTSTAVTLNVNGTGAKILRLPLSFNNAAMTTPKDAGFFTAGRPITVQYDANYTTGGAWKTIGKMRTSAQDLYGTVPVESGGTGAADAATARANLGITVANLGAAASSHNHAASDITSGTLPIARGGTGSTTAAAARTALGITPANIGAVTKATASVSLSASGWSGSGPYTQTVSASGVTASNTVIVAPVYASQEKYNDCGVGASAQASGKLTFTAQSKPSSTLSVNVLILN